MFHRRSPAILRKYHFYILRPIGVERECYAIGVQSGPWSLSYYNRPEYQVLFYKGVPSTNPHLLNRLQDYLFDHHEHGPEIGPKHYFYIPYADLLTLVEAEFDKLKYVCKCKEFCQREQE